MPHLLVLALDPRLALASTISPTTISWFGTTVLRNTIQAQAVTAHMSLRRSPGTAPSRKLDPERAQRRRPLTARERLSDRVFCHHMEPHPGRRPRRAVLSAWIARGELRTLRSTVRVGWDGTPGPDRPHRFLT